MNQNLLQTKGRFIIATVAALVVTFSVTGCKKNDNKMNRAAMALIAAGLVNNTYTVTYDGNGNTGGTVPTDENRYSTDQTVTVLGNTGNLVKTGYLFNNWNTTADGSGTDYAPAQAFAMGSAGITLYTKWERWTRLLGVAGASTYGYGISVDSNGNSYVTGLTYGNLDGQTLTGTADVFVIKYDTSGAKQWTRLLGVAGSETRGRGISVDSSGNSYVTGLTYGNLDGQTLTGTRDVFVIKYDTSGGKQWTRLLGVAGAITEGYGISVDSSGNSYVTGLTYGNLDGQTLTGTRDVFVIKHDTSGAKQWTRLLGVAGKGATGNGISLDSSGNSYVTGFTNGDLDGQTLTGTGDVFVTTGLNRY